MGRLDRCIRLLVVLRRVRCCVLPFCDPFLFPVFMSMPQEPSFNVNYFSCRQGCVELSVSFWHSDQSIPSFDQQSVSCFVSDNPKEAHESRVRRSVDGDLESNPFMSQDVLRGYRHLFCLFRHYCTVFGR